MGHIGDRTSLNNHMKASSIDPDKEYTHEKIVYFHAKPSSYLEKAPASISTPGFPIEGRGVSRDREVEPHPNRQNDSTI